MDTVKDVKMRTRSLVGDPDGDFCTDAYLMPLINQAYEQAINSLSGTCSPFMTELIDLPNMPQGTTTLKDQQGPNKPLERLVNPLVIEYKQAGFPINQFREMRIRRILSNIPPNTSNLLAWLEWEWRAYVLYISPLPYPADIRVRGEFKPQKLQNDNDLIAIHPLMTAHLAFATAKLIGEERQNANYIQNYGADADEVLDDIEAELVRQQQGTTNRLGRASSGDRSLWRRGY